MDGKSRVNRVHKAVARALPVRIRAKAMARARVKAKARARTKAILYRLKDSVGVRVGKVMRGHHRHLSNSNLNLPITLFLTRKSYTGPDVTGDAAIQLGLLTLEQCNESRLNTFCPPS